MTYTKNDWDQIGPAIGQSKRSAHAFAAIEQGIYDAHTVLKYGRIHNDEFRAYEDLRFDANALKAAGVKDPAYSTVNGGLRAYLFSPTTQEELYLSVQFPHAWDGSAVYPHVHWFATTETTNITCRWGLEYAWAEIGSTFAAATTVYASTVSEATTVIEVNKHYLTPFAPITPSTVQDGISAMMLCRLFRDSTVAADTFDQSAALLEFDIHIRVNGIGSRDETRK